MNEWIQVMFWVLGIIGLLIAAGCVFFEIKNSRRMDCRVCGAELDRRGGYHAGMHSGFCPACATRIMREVRK